MWTFSSVYVFVFLFSMHSTTGIHYVHEKVSVLSHCWPWMWHTERWTMRWRMWLSLWDGPWWQWLCSSIFMQLWKSWNRRTNGGGWHTYFHKLFHLFSYLVLPNIIHFFSFNVAWRGIYWFWRMRKICVLQQYTSHDKHWQLWDYHF